MPKAKADGLIPVSKECLEALYGWRHIALEVLRIAPNMHSLKLMRDAAESLCRMEADFNKGATDDAAMDKFLSYWSGETATDPIERANLQAAFVKMTERVHKHLPKVTIQ